jgi:site-specific recombinase XerD
MVRLMTETVVRAGECAGLLLEDVDLRRRTVLVRRGKGGKGRLVGIGPQTCQALARYLRSRKGHAQESSPALWLGDRGKAFNYDGLHSALRSRARAAGIERFHPHLLRNTFAHRWLADNGSRAGLMAAAGWTRPDMMMRYAKFHEQARAVEESRRLNLGDV